MASSKEFALCCLVSLLSCFDHFIGVFDCLEAVDAFMLPRGSGEGRRALYFYNFYASVQVF